MLKKLALVAAAACLVFPQSFAQADEIEAQAVTSAASIVRKLADSFEAYSGHKVHLTTSSSWDAIVQCTTKKMDICFINRKLRSIEEARGLRGTAFAIDGIAVVVNRSNPKEKISLKELQQIYSGDIKAWESGKPIQAVNLDEGSGTREVFQRIVMDNQDNFDKSLRVASDKNAASTITDIPGGIAYQSVSTVDWNQVKVLKVNGILPGLKELKSHKYHISNFLVFATRGKQEDGPLKEFADFIFSETGGNIVQRAGYVPLKP